MGEGEGGGGGREGRDVLTLRCPLHGTLHSLVYRVMNLKNINGEEVVRLEQEKFLFSKIFEKSIEKNEKSKQDFQK